MKKLVIISVIVIIINSIYISLNKVVIPESSIRFRVIANSDNKLDQENKKKIAKQLSSDVMKKIKEGKTIEEARYNIVSNLDEFKKSAEEVARKNNYNTSIDINYGQNYFPEKIYKDVTYKSGNYESLVVKLGKGEGENFWCVLFPPLCLLEAEDEKTEKIEYKSFVKELIDKYF